jgi:hypothetical protein
MMASTVNGLNVLQPSRVLLKILLLPLRTCICYVFTIKTLPLMTILGLGMFAAETVLYLFPLLMSFPLLM